MEKINIFIVDKQPIFRQGIRQALASYEDIDVVGECSPDDNTWSLVENILPDITLVDLSTTPVTEFDVARKIATRCPKVAVVILAPNPDDDHLFQAIKSGAVAFLGKDVSADELADILRQVRRGEYPINDSLLSRPNSARQVLQLFQNFALKDMESLITPLSHREVEILKYVAEGNPNKSIAAALNISQQTVKNHITSIMRKLNANDRTHAVVLAMRSGLINLGKNPD
ncbi:MAG: response regulator transcription factor [Dehalococcoidales bacterium]|nr:response regulator transcription factor [Dehalococcoidales bacterium]